jgi:hypothetical protein
MCSILGKYWPVSVAVAGAVAVLVQSLPLLAALVPGLAAAAAAAAEGQVRCCYPWSPVAPGGPYSRQQSYHSAACMELKFPFFSSLGL